MGKLALYGGSIVDFAVQIIVHHLIGDAEFTAKAEQALAMTVSGLEQTRLYGKLKQGNCFEIGNPAALVFAILPVQSQIESLAAHQTAGVQHSQ